MKVYWMENLVRSSNLSTKKSNIKMFISLKRIFGWNVFNRCEWPQQLWNFRNDMLLTTPKLFSSNLSTKPLQDSWFWDDKCKSLDKNLLKDPMLHLSFLLELQIYKECIEWNIPYYLLEILHLERSRPEIYDM